MLKRITIGIVLVIIGNIVSLINKLKKMPINSILEPNMSGFATGNPKFIFLVSELIGDLPNHIPLPFNCYERALTARFIFNLLKIKSTFYIGFNPKASNRQDKLHAWLDTDVCEVCGFAIKDKYLVLKKYE